MKILVMAYGDGSAASTQYRFLACQGIWQSLGHRVDIVPAGSLPEDFWSRVNDCDAIINQKALLSAGLARRLGKAGRPIYFDFDDAIWTRPRKPYSWWTQRRVDYRIRRWFEPARGIFAANQYLAAFAKRFNSSVEVVPMGLDLEIWRPGPRVHGGVRIGWAGSPANLWHLEKLREPLSALLKGRPEVRLAVFCGRKPSFEFPFEYVPYAPGGERDFVAGLDIGLLPLESEPYSLGKSPIKALQYLSCGVPVVGNVAGATAELLNPENSVAIRAGAEWFPVLESLVARRERMREMGEAGRRHVERYHDLRQVTLRMIGVLVGALDSR